MPITTTDVTVGQAGTATWAHAVYTDLLSLSNGALKSVADVSTAQAITGMSDGDKIYIPTYGAYVYSSSYASGFDSETAIQPTSGGGGWLLIAPTVDMIWTALVPEFAARDADLARLTDNYNLLAAKYNTLAAAYNDLATKFNAHTHSGVTTGAGSTGANNQTAASTSADTSATANLTYVSEL